MSEKREIDLSYGVYMLLAAIAGILWGIGYRLGELVRILDKLVKP